VVNCQARFKLEGWIQEMQQLVVAMHDPDS